MPMIPDLTSNQASTGFAPQCPPGVHPMRVASIEERTNAKGNTSHFVTFEALDLPGHIARDNFMITSTSGSNTEIGRNRYKGLLICLGFTTFAGLDTAHLIGRAVEVTVVNEPWTNNDGKTVDSAKASSYRKLAQAQQAAPRAAAPAIAQADVEAPF